MITTTLSRRAILLGAAAATFASQGFAQTFNIRFLGQTNQLLRGGPIGIPSYQITFFTQQQGTAVGSVLARSRLTTTLTGVSEQVMRDLVDEAYADLKTKLEAAQIPMLPEATTRASVDASGWARTPNNAEVVPISAGITIGQSVRKAYAAYGASAVPMLQGQNAPNSPTGVAGIAAFAQNNRLADAAKKNNAVLVSPSLVIDFAKSDASTGRSLTGRATASVSTDVQFTVAMGTQASLMTSMNNGRASTPGAMRLREELAIATPFATVATGEGAVRALSVGVVADSNYIDQDTARGDAVIVNVPVWQGLVRTAFKDFNTALVAEFVKARG